MHPDTKPINEDLAAGWTRVRTATWAALNKLYTDQDIRGKSSRVSCVMANVLALHYLMIIHQYMEDTYVPTMTEAEVKTLFSWDTLDPCFACHDVNLDDLWTAFDIASLL